MPCKSINYIDDKIFRPWLKDEIIKALDDLGFESPTEIQQKTIPHLLNATDDLKAFAQTGAGKTAAFDLPLVELLAGKKKTVQAIILSHNKRISRSN